MIHYVTWVNPSHQERSMKASTAVFVTVLLLGALGCAQDASSAGAGQDSAQSVAGAAKASRAQVDIRQAKEADIHRLLELTHAGALATQTMDGMEGNIRPLMANSFPPGEYRDKLIDLFFTKFHAKRDPQQLLDIAVPVYDKYYSDDEVKQLIHLYETPLGQKMLTVMPKLMAELQAAGEKWGEELGRQSMMEVLAEHPEMEKALRDAQTTAQPAK
jgi:hypothetical protein